MGPEAETAGRGARELETLAEISRVATEGKDLRPTLQRITDLLAERFGWEFVAVVSIDRERNAFVCEAVTSSHPTEVESGYSRPLGSGVVGQVAATGKPVLLDDVRTFENYVETLPGALSELCVPVLWAEGVLAVLNLESTRLAAFRGQGLLLETVARQMAGPLHLAWTNRRLEETVSELRSAQNEIGRLLASAPGGAENVPAWARALAREIARAVGVREIGIWEVDRGEVVRLTEDATRPPTAEEMRGISSGTLIATGENDVLIGIEGMSGEVFGAVVVPSRRPLLDESGKRLLLGFARQLGAALDMKRMREQLAASEARRAATRREMHERGIATLQVCPSCGRCYDHEAPRCEDDGAALDASRLLPHVLHGRWRFLRQLGQGGMGTVFLAEDAKLRREVAIKLIRPEHFGNREMRTRFEREALAVARIQHPGVVALYDSGELEDGTSFLVMERIHGRDLEKVIDGHGPGTPAQVARLLRRAGSALAAAHAAGIVHRDVKPQNIFLFDGADGFDAKVFDFGLARSIGGETRLTRFGMLVGTPAYLPPEAARGEPAGVRGDLYALAAVGFEALTGRPAIEGSDVARILANVLDQRTPRLSEILGKVPLAVDEAFLAALAKDPIDRPRDVPEWLALFADELERMPATRPGWPPEAFRERRFASTASMPVPRIPRAPEETRR